MGNVHQETNQNTIKEKKSAPMSKVTEKSEEKKKQNNWLNMALFKSSSVL